MTSFASVAKRLAAHRFHRPAALLRLGEQLGIFQCVAPSLAQGFQSIRRHSRRRHPGSAKFIGRHHQRGEASFGVAGFILVHQVDRTSGVSGNCASRLRPVWTKGRVKPLLEPTDVRFPAKKSRDGDYAGTAARRAPGRRSMSAGALVARDDIEFHAEDFFHELRRVISDRACTGGAAFRRLRSLAQYRRWFYTGYRRGNRTNNSVCSGVPSQLNFAQSNCTSLRPISWSM